MSSTTSCHQVQPGHSFIQCTHGFVALFLIVASYMYLYVCMYTRGQLLYSKNNNAIWKISYHFTSLKLSLICIFIKRTFFFVVFKFCQHFRSLFMCPVLCCSQQSKCHVHKQNKYPLFVCFLSLLRLVVSSFIYV